MADFAEEMRSRCEDGFPSAIRLSEHGEPNRELPANVFYMEERGDEDEAAVYVHGCGYITQHDQLLAWRHGKRTIVVCNSSTYLGHPKYDPVNLYSFASTKLEVVRYSNLNLKLRFETNYEAMNSVINGRQKFKDEADLADHVAIGRAGPTITQLVEGDFELANSNRNFHFVGSMNGVTNIADLDRSSAVHTLGFIDSVHSLIAFHEEEYEESSEWWDDDDDSF